MGLTAEVYRWTLGDCSNGGISSRVDKVTIVNADGPFEPSEDAPAVELVAEKHFEWATIRAVPVDAPEDRRNGPMMGGAYVATSDSRFREAIERLIGHGFYGAVALHDRWE